MTEANLARSLFSGNPAKPPRRKAKGSVSPEPLLEDSSETPNSLPEAPQPDSVHLEAQLQAAQHEILQLQATLQNRETWIPPEQHQQVCLQLEQAQMEIKTLEQSLQGSQQQLAEITHESVTQQAYFQHSLQQLQELVTEKDKQIKTLQAQSQPQSQGLKAQLPSPPKGSSSYPRVTIQRPVFPNASEVPTFLLD